jgi:hypothetical protein
LCEIDHIRAIANGGDPKDITNLQMLCKDCHHNKTLGEKEIGFRKQSETESSFNSTVKEIFNSSLCGAHPFVEKVADPIKADQKVFHIDINKCYKNACYYSNFDYPLFTVMDRPIYYKGQVSPGLYYVETNLYMPMRGNGWYYYPMIKYCLENDLIKPTDIKYCIIASLSIKNTHYNDFIDFCYNSNNFEKSESKQAVNGNFKSVNIGNQL